MQKIQIRIIRIKPFFFFFKAHGNDGKEERAEKESKAGS